MIKINIGNCKKQCLYKKYVSNLSSIEYLLELFRMIYSDKTNSYDNIYYYFYSASHSRTPLFPYCG